MSSSDENLTAKQERFLAALLVSPTVADAAKAANVADSTARRWLAQPDIHRAWLDRRREVVDQAMTGVQLATRAAVATLLDCLKEKYPAGVRVRAATALLDTAIRAVEIGDLAARIEELEQANQVQVDRQKKGLRYVG